jgi:hypothetical protein
VPGQALKMLTHPLSTLREKRAGLVYNKTLRQSARNKCKNMIRFLQTPGPIKKVVLGGLLVVICAAMVIVLVPGGILGDAFGFQSDL